MEGPSRGSNSIEVPSQAYSSLEVPSRASNSMEVPSQAFNSLEVPSLASNSMEAPSQAYNSLEGPSRAANSTVASSMEVPGALQPVGMVGIDPMGGDTARATFNYAGADLNRDG